MLRSKAAPFSREVWQNLEKTLKKPNVYGKLTKVKTWRHRLMSRGA